MSQWYNTRKKPVIIQFREVKAQGEYLKNDVDNREYFVDPKTHFIIKGVRGEMYSIEKSIFYETYEVLDDV